jgi:hypothetical protein
LTPYAKIDGSRNFTGQETFENNVIIRGNLVVSGTQFITETEDVFIEDHLLTLNYGETGAGVSFPYAGIEIERGSLTNYLFVYDETDDNFQVGVSGSLQAVATREDTPTSSGFAYWNASQYRFDTSATYTPDTMATKSYADTISGALNLSKSDIGHNHSGVYQPVGSYATTTELSTASGTLHDEIVATSGTLQNAINNINITVIAWNAPSTTQTYQGITSTATISGSTPQGYSSALRLGADGAYYDAYATTISGAPCTALATYSGTGSQTIFKFGYFRNDNWNLTPGYPVYLSTTSGSITQTIVSGTGQVVQILGYAENSHVIWFQPNTAYAII